MKKVWSVTAAVLFAAVLLLPQAASAAPFVADSYPSANMDGTRIIRAGSTQFIGQSFTAVDGWIDSVTFYMLKLGNPSGNAVARLYAHTGTYGTDSRPGTVLATSSFVALSEITATGGTIQAVTFPFPTPVQLTAGQNYVVAVQSNNGDSSNYVAVRTDVSFPAHPGNLVSSTNGTTWSVQTITDVGFVVYETLPDTEAPVIAANVSEGASYPTPKIVTFSATDGVDGPVPCTATLDGSAFTSGSSVVVPGPHTLVITASDSVPNTAVSTIHFTVLPPPDTEPPVINSSVAESGSYDAPVAVTFSASDAVDGPVPCGATLNGDPFASGSSIAAPGSYTLVITAADSVPNTSVSTVHFDVTDPPPLVVSTPAASAWTLALLALGGLGLVIAMRKRSAAH